MNCQNCGYKYCPLVKRGGRVMSECKNCTNAGNECCLACENGNQFNSMTNADRIRGMTDEEMANILHKIRGDCCSEEYWLNWLKQEVEEV